MASCALPGCNKTCYVDPSTGIAHKYCSRNHAQLHQSGGSIASTPPTTPAAPIAGGKTNTMKLFSTCGINQPMYQLGDFPLNQRILPHDCIVYETNNDLSSEKLDIINLKLKMLIDFVQIECPSQNEVLNIVNSPHSGRVLCCISTTSFTINSCPFPIFNIADEELILKVVKLFRDKTEIIYFYNSNEPYYHFANFFELPEQIMYEIGTGVMKTTEHYFQSKKFIESNLRIQILETKTPRDAFSAARKLNSYKIPNWEEVKDSFMREALHVKFNISDLKYLLYFTGKAHIYEHTENDNYWADGGFQLNGTGKNMLGTMLMQLRSKIEMPELTKQDVDNFFHTSWFYNYFLYTLRNISGPVHRLMQFKKEKQSAKLTKFYKELEQNVKQQSPTTASFPQGNPTTWSNNKERYSQSILVGISNPYSQFTNSSQSRY